MELLGRFGGLWVDATLFAISPIEAWLSAVLSDDPAAHGSGFFSVRYPVDGPDQVANWLLYARGPHNVIVQYMRHNLRLFWHDTHKLSRSTATDRHGDLSRQVLSAQ